MSKSKLHIEIIEPVLHFISSCADEQKIEAYVVGGYVRDKILGKESKDIDVMIVGDGINFAKTVAKRLGRTNIILFEKFGTAMLPFEKGNIEFVTAREESYAPSSRKPRVKKASMDSDLSRRDFTINALAGSLGKEKFGEVHDPFDGLTDLKHKILRTPLSPEQTFEDDPLRMMRAIRFAAQLEFKIEEKTLDAIKFKNDRILIVSKERITDEFLKILSSNKPSIGLELLHDCGLAKHVFPELEDMVGVEQRKDFHHKDVFIHTLKVVDKIAEESENLWLRFAALAHDIAKPKTKAFKENVGWTFHGHEEIGARMMKSIFKRMRLPLEHLHFVEKIVRLHLRPMVLVSEEITDSAVRRLLFEAGNDIEDLMLLCRADITSQNPARVARYLQNYDIVMEKMKEVEEKDRLRNWQPPVRGDEIMEVCNIKPGPLVGVLKQKIEDAILDGQIPNEHDAALNYLLSIKNSVLSENS